MCVSECVCVCVPFCSCAENKPSHSEAHAHDFNMSSKEKERREGKERKMQNTQVYLLQDVNPTEHTTIQLYVILHKHYTNLLYIDREGVSVFVLIRVFVV